MKERELTKVIRRMAIKLWQMNQNCTTAFNVVPGDPHLHMGVPSYWEQARAMYDEVIKIDEERVPCQDSANFQEKR